VSPRGQACQRWIPMHFQRVGDLSEVRKALEMGQCIVIKQSVGPKCVTVPGVGLHAL
jgi:hypothetical protein